MYVWGLWEHSPTQLVINALEIVCRLAGLTLSRWQSNRGSHQVTITYMAHTGPRARQARYQDQVVAHCVLVQREGNTTRSSAYRMLGHMLQGLMLNHYAMSEDEREWARDADAISLAIHLIDKHPTSDGK